MGFAEEDVERCQRAVDGCDVLLHVDLFGFCEAFVTVDFLFDEAEAVADHDDFMKEYVDGYFFVLQGAVGRLKDHIAACPAVAQGDELHFVQAALQDGVEGVFNVRKGDLAWRGIRWQSLSDFHSGEFFGYVAGALLGLEPDRVVLRVLIDDNAAAEEVMLHAGADACAGFGSLRFHLTNVMVPDKIRTFCTVIKRLIKISCEVDLF